METGPCRGNYLRFYYDKDTKQCAPFTYGGCQGNNNNFLSMEACQQKCATPGQKKGKPGGFYSYKSNQHGLVRKSHD